MGERRPERAERARGGIAFAAACVALACAHPSGGGDFAYFRGANDSELNWVVCPELFPPGCQLAPLREDAATGATDFFLRVPGGFALPRHAHAAPWRMLGVAGRWRLDSDAHRGIELAPGGFAVEPALAPHALRCDGEEPCVLFVASDAPIGAAAAP